MSVDVSVQVAKPRMLAAVRRQVLVGQVGTAWRPTLDRVREFLSHHPGLRADGRNVCLYHHPAARHLPMEVNFGVEIVRPFEEAGEVHLVETPGERSRARCTLVLRTECARLMMRSTDGRPPWEELCGEVVGDLRRLDR
jgi:hypothetical protein